LDNSFENIIDNGRQQSMIKSHSVCDFKFTYRKEKADANKQVIAEVRNHFMDTFLSKKDTFPKKYSKIEMR